MQKFLMLIRKEISFEIINEIPYLIYMSVFLMLFFTDNVNLQMPDFFDETIQPLWQSAQFDNLLVFTDVARYGGVLVDDVAAEMFEVLGESEEEVEEDVAAEHGGEMEGDLYGKQEAG